MSSCVFFYRNLHVDVYRSLNCVYNLSTLIWIDIVKRVSTSVASLLFLPNLVTSHSYTSYVVISVQLCHVQSLHTVAVSVELLLTDAKILCLLKSLQNEMRCLVRLHALSLYFRVWKSLRCFSYSRVEVNFLFLILVFHMYMYFPKFLTFYDVADV